MSSNEGWQLMVVAVMATAILLTAGSSVKYEAVPSVSFGVTDHHEFAIEESEFDQKPLLGAGGALAKCLVKNAWVFVEGEHDWLAASRPEGGEPSYTAHGRPSLIELICGIRVGPNSGRLNRAFGAFGAGLVRLREGNTRTVGYAEGTTIIDGEKRLSFAVKPVLGLRTPTGEGRYFILSLWGLGFRGKERIEKCFGMSLGLAFGWDGSG